MEFKNIFLAVSITAVLCIESNLFAYSGGDGSAKNPYQIANVADFQQLSNTPDDWSRSIVLVANIDLTDLIFAHVPIAPDTDSGEGGGFQGAPFTGIFDGNGYIISYLTINQLDCDYVGLFGHIGAGGQVKNLCVENADITCRDFVGGLVGLNDGTIISCYARGAVSGTGENIAVGGLVGRNDGTIISCYAMGAISGTGENIAVGGLVGADSGSIASCFWDIETSGTNDGVGDIDPDSSGVAGKTTAEMKTLSTFTDAGWDFVGESANGLHDYWQMEINSYPRLATHAWTLAGEGTVSNPYIVANASDLGKIWLRPSFCYRLANNMDLNGISWATAVVPCFTGIFDGQGHIICNLTITVSAQDCVGLFGNVGSSGQIYDLTLEDFNIAGRYCVGGLVGLNESGTLTNCYAAGSVSGRESVGGLLGFNHKAMITSCCATGLVTGTEYSSTIGGLVGENAFGTLRYCYATGSIRGNSRVGGLVGRNYGTITSCYATGSVTGHSSVGGLVGENYFGSSSVFTCFWDIEASGTNDGVGDIDPDSSGVAGKTTAEMKTLSTFTDAGWDFVNTWWMPVGDRPRLISFSGTFTLSIQANPSFITSVSPPFGQYTVNGEVNISATNFSQCPEVYQFDHWEGGVDDPNSASTTVFVNSNKTITAVFTLAAPVCGDECHPNFTVGDLNHDCYVDIQDFAILSSRWMNCTHPVCD